MTASPIIPRLSDGEIASKRAAGQTRKRKGLEDTDLTGGIGTSNDGRRYASLLGRAT